MRNRIDKLGKIIAAGFIAWASPLSAIAEAAEQSGYGEIDKGKVSSGLPQLDPSGYSSQLFWLAVTFIVLFVIFNTKTLPEISSVLENRKERIQGDLNTAEKLRNNAEQTQKEYEALLERARSESTKVMQSTVADMQDRSDKELSKFQEDAQKKVLELEGNIQTAKKKAMKDMNVIAAEVARDAAEKIVGIKADLNQAKTVVKSLSEKEAA